MLRKWIVLTLMVFLLTGLLSACAGTMDTPTATPVAPTATESVVLQPTSTPEPTVTALPSPTASPTTASTATETPLPFAGFLPDFRFFRAWHDQETTIFYFLNAGIDHTLYGKADAIDLLCNPDPKNPTGMICRADEKIEGPASMVFEFFTDAARQNSVLKQTFTTGLADNTVWHYQTNCPQRGQNVTCESEYRIYDGVCYYSHTCFDACGLYYSRDNLPKVFNEFQGFTGPCN